MRGKLTLLVGVGVGYVLGTRAGRQKYDEMVNTARRLLDSPTVKEASGVVQSQASKLYEQGKETIGNSKLAEKLKHGASNGDEVIDDLTHQHMSTNSF